MGVSERGIIKKTNKKNVNDENPVIQRLSDKTAICMLGIFRARTESTSDRLICTN